MKFVKAPFEDRVSNRLAGLLVGSFVDRRRAHPIGFHFVRQWPVEEAALVIP
jgi:hypothetical protein